MCDIESVIGHSNLRQVLYRNEGVFSDYFTKILMPILAGYQKKSTGKLVKPFSNVTLLNGEEYEPVYDKDIICVNEYKSQNLLSLLVRG